MTLVIGLDLPGLLTTMLLLGPRYAALTALAVCGQELGRVIAAVSLGGEISEVWLGGFFGRTVGQHLSPLCLMALGPAWSLLSGLCLMGGYRPGLLKLLHPAAQHERPLGTVLLKLSVGSAVVALWQFFSR